MDVDGGTEGWGIAAVRRPYPPPQPPTVSTDEAHQGLRNGQTGAATLRTRCDPVPRANARYPLGRLAGKFIHRTSSLKRGSDRTLSSLASMAMNGRDEE